jgi:hypothetical protein
MSLVQFDAPYYKYPKSVSRGYWGRYLSESDLSKYEIERRSKWITEVSKYSQSDFHNFVSNNFTESSDSELLYSLIPQHGIYIEKYFLHNIRFRVLRKLTTIEIDFSQLQKQFSLAYGLNSNLFSTNSMASFWIVDHIYQQLLLNAISDSKFKDGLASWFMVYSQTRKCSLCNNEFRIIDLPDWIYFGSNGCKTCCFQCPILGTPLKSDLASLIPEFIHSCGFIPNSDAGPINYAFTSRLPSDKWNEVILKYSKMGGIEHVKAKYKSWFEALAQTGSLPNGVLSTSRGIKCLAKDGHVCHSLDEQRIDNWLNDHNLKHEREPIYPIHPTLNPTGRRRGDWKVNDTFIEYFGLIGDKDYEKKMEEKILLAGYNNINLIEVYPNDIDVLDLRLRSLIQS